MQPRAILGFISAIAVCTVAMAPSFYQAGKYRLGECFKYFRELEAGAVPRTEMEDQCILYASQGMGILPLAQLVGLLVLGFGILFRTAKLRTLSLAVVVGVVSTLFAGPIGFAASGVEAWMVFLDPRLYVASILAAGFGVVLLFVDKRVAA